MGKENDFELLNGMESVCHLFGTVCKDIFTGKRPAVTDRKNEFLVISIPGAIEPLVHGQGYGNIPTYCDIEIYVRLRKSGHENFNRMSELISMVTELLPYSDEFVSISNPSVKLKGLDGLGFSAVLIRTELVLK